MDGPYHYIVQPSARHAEFYDLAVDPNERIDLSDSVSYGDQLSAARRRIVRLLEGDL